MAEEVAVVVNYETVDEQPMATSDVAVDADTTSRKPFESLKDAYMDLFPGTTAADWAAISSVKSHPQQAAARKHMAQRRKECGLTKSKKREQTKVTYDAVDMDFAKNIAKSMEAFKSCIDQFMNTVNQLQDVSDACAKRVKQSDTN